MTTPPIEPGDRLGVERRDSRWLGIVLPVAWLLFGLLGGFVIIQVVDGGKDAPAAAETTRGPRPSEPTGASTAKKPARPSASRTPRPKPTPTPTTQATQVPVARTVPVSVYNQVGIGGLARRVAGQVQALGWPLGTVDDWRGGVPQDTVYYPAGRRGEADLLARDLGIVRVMPAVAPMSASNLTVILASPR